MFLLNYQLPKQLWEDGGRGIKATQEWATYHVTEPQLTLQAEKGTLNLSFRMQHLWGEKEVSFKFWKLSGEYFGNWGT